MDAAEQAAAMLAGSKPSSDFTYLNRKFGRYELEIQAFKFVKGGKPCVEAKVLKAEKTSKDCEPHKVGEVVSHLEDIAEERKGGRGRLLKMLLAILQMEHAEIQKLEIEKDGKIRELEGANAEKLWLVKMMSQEKQPTAFMRVAVEIEPRVTEGGTFSKEKWSKVELDDKALDEIEAKRAAAELPPIAESLK